MRPLDRRGSPKTFEPSDCEELTTGGTQALQVYVISQPKPVFFEVPSHSSLLLRASKQTSVPVTIHDARQKEQEARHATAVSRERHCRRGSCGCAVVGVGAVR